MTEAETKEALRSFKADPYGKGFPRCLKILPKKGPMVPFTLNEPQVKVARNRSRFTMVLKPRQDGITTYGNAEGFWGAMSKKGYNAIALNLQADVSEKMFERVRLFYQEWPVWMKTEPVRDNVKKLMFQHGSSFDAWNIKENMGKEEANKLGRSFTCQFFHGTEVCFWTWYREILNGLLDAIPPGGQILLESTGNGAQGGAYEDFMEIIEKGEQAKGEKGVWRWGDRTAIFIAWFESSERRLDEDPFKNETIEAKTRYFLKETEAEHREAMTEAGVSESMQTKAIYWRRAKLKEKGLFRDPVGAIRVVDREFPGTVRHAFQATGQAFLSLSLTDTLREYWKAQNKQHPPMMIGLIQKGMEKPTVNPLESEFMVWDAPIPGWKNRYCVGGDVGAGHPDGDRDVIFVKDRVTNKYVAVAHGSFGPQEWAKKALKLAAWYEGAKLSFECNNHGIGVQIRIGESDYQNVYRFDSNAEGYKGLGYQTTEKSRKDGLGHLKLGYEDMNSPIRIPYLEFYTEAAAFQIPPGKTKPEGQGGVHDDLIMGGMVTEMCSLSMEAPEREKYVPEYGANQVGSIRQRAIADTGKHSKALTNYGG